MKNSCHGKAKTNTAQRFANVLLLHSSSIDEQDLLFSETGTSLFFYHRILTTNVWI